VRKLKRTDWLERFEPRVEAISTTCSLQAFAEQRETRVAMNSTLRRDVGWAHEPPMGSCLL
jgi:hypothetical protein